MTYGLGPRTRRVYDALRARIARGEWSPGTKLTPHLELAVAFGVAPMTIRQVLARLEAEGLVSRQIGRGTFVREARAPAVLIVGTELAPRGLLVDTIAWVGLRAIVADGTAAGVRALEEDPSIIVALVSLYLPMTSDGIDFVRAARHRWPTVPVAGMTTSLANVADLYGTPEWPLFILSVPIDLGHLEGLLRLVARGALASPASGSPHLSGASGLPS